MSSATLNRRPTEDQLRARYAELFELIERGEAPERSVRALELIREMRGEDAAEVLGISRSLFYQRLQDPLDQKANIRKAKRHGICVDCGRKTFNAGSLEMPKRCDFCNRAKRTKESREWLISELQEWNRRYGSPPGAMDWNLGMAKGKAHREVWEELLRRHENHKWPVAGAVQSAFGSWNEGLNAAGFEVIQPGQRRHVDAWREHIRGAHSSDEDLLAVLVRISEGESISRPTYEERRGPLDPCGQTLIGRFGSWTNARRRAGLPDRHPQKGRKKMAAPRKAVDIIQREVDRNEERQKRVEEQLVVLRGEHDELLAAKAALNGSYPKK